MSKSIREAIKPIGRQLLDIVKNEHIKSIDVWTTKEPGTITVQYTDVDGAIKHLYLDCKED